ncbi:DegT/DnrJ/EryC1/StrS family aminotransferase [Noviherbaspirillum galbum]|uniref:DegT/DnrJ/EryC1/StrS aminotransferase family protein n=1 Tax=Noviherbaspirillum galbum TaxID=2709383 RepID=A0A6B3STN0_9BURK|nr:DegT/DnrJ/EryC1/StrS aminotransferase family protein [Noviherbaspirillum galbum]NEX64034.1 DegT/DnrJ/EryC1/StrS aminotransferase family protein [Noviherbaspirillum galbum]
MLNTPFSPWPSFTPEEARRIGEVLLSNKVNYWTGEECCHFEQEFAGWAGTRHAVAVANGTVALDLAFKALGIGAGDEVIVTPRTFLASVSSIVNAGATPVFADVDRDSQNITARTIGAVLGPRTRAIVCVHLAGWPCDMDPIMALARQRGLYVIEDCAQAHGAVYKGRKVGGIGDVGAWSFCQDKIISTGGEGGMVTTNDEALWRRMWSYKDHGKSWEAVYERAHPPGFRWLHDSFGTNWRMLEIQAALGRMQLARLPAMSAARRANAARLAAACRPFKVLRVPVPPPDVEHACYRFYAFVEPRRLAGGWSRDRIVDEINARGVPCFQGTCSEVYLERAFDGTGLRPRARLPVARELGETSLAMLVHPTLTQAELDEACRALAVVLAKAEADDTPRRSWRPVPHIRPGELPWRQGQGSATGTRAP